METVMATAKADAAQHGREFFKSLARDGLTTPVYVITGEERFLVDEALARIRALALPSGDDLNLATFRCGECSVTDVVYAARTMPMFAPRRFVILRGAERLLTADLAVLAEYSRDPEPTSVLLIEATKIDGRLKPVKELLGQAKVTAVDFPELRDRDAQEWVVRRARSRGLLLGQYVDEYLVDALGPGLSNLDHALERIDLFIGPAADAEPRRVVRETAAQVVVDTRARSIFELTDAVASRSLDKALRCFEKMMEAGESPIGVVSMIARQFRQLRLVREGLREGLRGRDLAESAEVPPFRLGDYEQSAKRFSLPELARVSRLVLDADRALKSSRLDDDLLVERLLMAIALPPRSERRAAS
jgi:DNA polymerase-3 subunit delta